MRASRTMWWSQNLTVSFVGVHHPIAAQLGGKKNTFNVHEVGRESGRFENRKCRRKLRNIEAAWPKLRYTKFKKGKLGETEWHRAEKSQRSGNTCPCCHWCGWWWCRCGRTGTCTGVRPPQKTRSQAAIYGRNQGGFLNTQKGRQAGPAHFHQEPLRFRRPISGPFYQVQKELSERLRWCGDWLKSSSNSIVSVNEVLLNSWFLETHSVRYFPDYLFSERILNSTLDIFNSCMMLRQLQKYGDHNFKNVSNENKYSL